MKFKRILVCIRKKFKHIMYRIKLLSLDPLAMRTVLAVLILAGLVMMACSLGFYDFSKGK